MRPLVPPAGNDLTGAVNQAKPGRARVEDRRRDKTLQQVMIFRVLLACSQHLLPGGCVGDDASTATPMSRLNNKALTQDFQVRRHWIGLLAARWNDQGFGSCQTGVDKLPMNGGFIPGMPCQAQAIDIDDRILAGPLAERHKTRIRIRGAIEIGMEG